MKIEKILSERQQIHGSFEDFAAIEQGFMKVAEASPNWPDNLTDTQKSGIRMILHKVTRILNGDPSHLDHWVDIEGYARLSRSPSLQGLLKGLVDNEKENKP